MNTNTVPHERAIHATITPAFRPRSECVLKRIVVIASDLMGANEETPVSRSNAITEADLQVIYREAKSVAKERIH